VEQLHGAVHPPPVAPVAVVGLLQFVAQLQQRHQALQRIRAAQRIRAGRNAFGGLAT
jgi:hypothetical protein